MPDVLGRSDRTTSSPLAANEALLWLESSCGPEDLNPETGREQVILELHQDLDNYLVVM